MDDHFNTLLADFGEALHEHNCVLAENQSKAKTEDRGVQQQRARESDRRLAQVLHTLRDHSRKLANEAAAEAAKAEAAAEDVAES